MTQKWAPTHLGKLALPRANLGRKAQFRPPNRPTSLLAPLLGREIGPDFAQKGPFPYFPINPWEAGWRAPPPAKRSGWDTQNVEKIRPRPTDPKPVLGQSGAKTNVLEAAEGPSARPAAHTHIWADRTSPKTHENKGKVDFGGHVFARYAL